MFFWSWIGWWQLLAFVFQKTCKLSADVYRQAQPKSKFSPGHRYEALDSFLVVVGIGPSRGLWRRRHWSSRRRRREISTASTSRVRLAQGNKRIGLSVAKPEQRYDSNRFLSCVGIVIHISTCFVVEYFQCRALFHTSTPFHDLTVWAWAEYCRHQSLRASTGTPSLQGQSLRNEMPIEHQRTVKIFKTCFIVFHAWKLSQGPNRALWRSNKSFSPVARARKWSRQQHGIASWWQC